MFHEVEGNSTGGSAEIQSEPPAASAEGAVLGSAAPGSTLSHDQFWSSVVPQPEIRRQDPEQDIQSLFHIREGSQVDDSTKTELNALGAHDVTEIFHHQDSQRSAKHSDYFLDMQLTWRQVGT